MGLFFDEVTVGELEDAVVEIVGWGLAAGAFVRNGEADIALLEEAWNEDMAPLLLEEGVLLDLLAALTALLLGLAHAEKGSAKTVVTVSVER